IHVMRQLQVLDESGGLHAVRVREDEFLVLCRRAELFTQLARAQRAVDERHGHCFALALAEGETVTAGEARGLAGRSLELVDHLTFGQRDPAERDGEADLLGEELDLDLAVADLAGERMRAAETPLRRIAQRKQETFVAARKILQAYVAFCGKRERLAR